MSSCYGLADELPSTESAPIRPQYPYALSKCQGEQAVLHGGEVYRLPVNSVRIFNAYGIRSRTSGAYDAGSRADGGLADLCVLGIAEKGSCWAERNCSFEKPARADHFLC
jgi:nucleoside-diphosphate-sugar epimerase